MSPSNRGITAVQTVVRLVLVVALALTSLSVVAGVACSQEGKAFVSLMDAAPDATGRFTYWAVGELNRDEDLWVVYDRFKGSADAGQLKDLVQVLSIVEDAARIVGSDNTVLSEAPVTVLRGEFNDKDIEARLEAMKCTRSPYRGVNTWVLGDGQSYRPVALLSGTILMGDVSDLEACIDARKAKEQSLGSSPSINNLVKRLPDGFLVEVDRATAPSSEKYGDLVVYGKSYSKVNKDALRLTAVYLFVDEPAASSAEPAILSSLSAAFEEVKVKRDGNLVIATSRVVTSEFAETLVF